MADDCDEVLTSGQDLDHLFVDIFAGLSCPQVIQVIPHLDRDLVVISQLDPKLLLQDLNVIGISEDVILSPNQTDFRVIDL